MAANKMDRIFLLFMDCLLTLSTTLVFHKAFHNFM